MSITRSFNPNLSGLLAIRFLLGFLEKHSVKAFVFYRLFLSLALLGWLLSP